MHTSLSVSLTRLVQPEFRYATVLEIQFNLKKSPFKQLELAYKQLGGEAQVNSTLFSKQVHAKSFCDSNSSCQNLYLLSAMT